MPKHPNRSNLMAVLLAALVLAVPATARAQDDPFPETAGEAIHFYEEETAPERWAKGPVEYILLDYEEDIWNDLQSDAEREAFIQWFWDRRDPDPRDDQQPFKQAFYGRVATANQRFHGFPRGWRSDRGHVWVVLGQPNGGMRHTQLHNYGRCSAEDGEWWTYYTNGMAFSSSFGQFDVVFVEVRIGQYEVCDPTMLGPGSYPVFLRQALQIVSEAAVIDTTTEFEGVLASGDRTKGRLPVRDIEGKVEDLDVPAAEWGIDGIAGSVVVPVRLPLKDLLFEPQGDVLRASLQVEASMVPLGEGQGVTGTQQWTVELGADAASQIGGSTLQTALVLPAEPGGYSVRVRVTDPLSATNWVWDGSVEISADGSGATPPLVGGQLLRLRDSGEVAVLAQDPPQLSPGSPFAVVTWVRGAAVATDAITATLVDAESQETPVTISGAAWGNAAAAGPLVLQLAVPDVTPGAYVLRVDLGGELGASEQVVRVQ